jgi:polar amino acid transport system substrate-binding protein
VLAEEKLLACTEDADFPPFTYRDSTDPARPLKGSTVDLMARLASHLQRPIEIVQVSLKRCLAGVERGTYDMGLDFYKDEERQRRFEYSLPYVSLQPYYYYDKNRYPNGLEVLAKADLRKYRGCGVIGYSYAHYGLQPGPGFDVTAQSQVVAGRMLFAGRCDFFPTAKEIMDAYRGTGEREIVDNPRLGGIPVPGLATQDIHLIYPRNSARMQALRPAIDAFLSSQRAAGKAR